MDAGIADTLNRIDMRKVCEHLDAVDAQREKPLPWYDLEFVDEIIKRSDGTAAWMIVPLITRTPGVRFDGEPAGGDWDNLFNHFQAEVLARRDPQPPSVRAAAHTAEEPGRDGVGSL